jgi:hypothetical protein
VALLSGEEETTMTPKTVKPIILALVVAMLSLHALPAPIVAAEKYKLIVNSANPVTSLSRDEAARYFLKKSPAWPAGTGVAAVDLQKQSPTRGVFSRDVLHKSVEAVTAYWQQQIFSGRAVPPPEQRGDAEVVAFVESHRGAIGYVAESAEVGEAKVVRLVD